MARSPLMLVVSSCLLLAGASCLCAQEPPLPEWNEPSTQIPGDSLAPDPNSIPDNNAPVDLPPTDQIPDLPPLLPPADGEPPPAMPDVPGLIKPRIDISSNPADPSGKLNPALALDIPKVVNWITSPRQARIESLKSGKPMLFVFMGVDWSPSCRALNEDLFMNGRFNNFAREKLVLTFLNVPSKSGGLGGVSDDLKQRRLEAINAFRKHLKVRSLPTVIMFDGNGREVDRMVGYNFNRNLRRGSLWNALQRIEEMTKHCVKMGEETQKRRKLLADIQGYRWWTSNAGTTLFAKTVGLTTSPNPTEEQPEATEPAVVFMAEDGHRLTVALRQLQIGDREVIKRTLGPGDPPARVSTAESVSAPSP